MASALSATVCSASSTSVFDTDRMASRSLTSARPMIDSVDDMDAGLLVRWLEFGFWSGRAVGLGESRRVGEAGGSGRGRGRGESWVNPGSRKVATNRSATARSVRSWHSGSRPWPMIMRTTHSAVSRAACGSRNRSSSGAPNSVPMVSSGSSRSKATRASTGPGSWFSRYCSASWVRMAVTPSTRATASISCRLDTVATRADNPSRKRRSSRSPPRAARTASRRGRPGRSWPASSRPPGRCRRRWTWPCPTGRCTAARPRGCDRTAPPTRRGRRAPRSALRNVPPWPATIRPNLSHCQGPAAVTSVRCSRSPRQAWGRSSRMPARNWVRTSRRTVDSFVRSQCPELPR